MPPLRLPRRAAGGIVQIMGLSTFDLVRMLREMHGGWDERSLESRVRYFMRRDWPSEAVRAGRGSKVELGADDLMKFVLAVEMLDALVPPGSSADMTDAAWPDLRSALSSSWNERATRKAALPVLVRSDVSSGPGPNVVVAATADDVRGWLNGRGAFRWMIVLDFARLVRGVEEALREVLSPPELRSMIALIDQWAA